MYISVTKGSTKEKKGYPHDDLPSGRVCRGTSATNLLVFAVSPGWVLVLEAATPHAKPSSGEIVDSARVGGFFTVEPPTSFTITSDPE